MTTDKLHKGWRNNMVRKIMRMHGDERGITGLETAIILIAFVVVAAVFAYTALSSGLFATEKSKQAVNSGLNETQSTLQLKGSVIAYENDTDGDLIGKIAFNVSNAVQGGQPIDLTPSYTTDGVDLTGGGSNRLQISYADTSVSVADCAWTLSWVGENDSDNMLDDGEQAVITVWLTDFQDSAWVTATGDPFVGANTLAAYEKFSIEVKPAAGAVLAIERTIPGSITPVIDLH